MLFEWRVPKVMAGNKALTLLFHEIHTVSAWLLLGLIGLHVLAALFRRLVLKDEGLQSMLPWPISAMAPRRRFLSSLTICSIPHPDGISSSWARVSASFSR